MLWILGIQGFSFDTVFVLGTIISRGETTPPPEAARMNASPNARTMNNAHNNGSKKQRFSGDAAKAQWYAASRARRFARRLGFTTPTQGA
jgi:hypothetical protein